MLITAIDELFTLFFFFTGSSIFFFSSEKFEIISKYFKHYLQISSIPKNFVSYVYVYIKKKKTFKKLIIFNIFNDKATGSSVIISSVNYLIQNLSEMFELRKSTLSFHVLNSLIPHLGISTSMFLRQVPQADRHVGHRRLTEVSSHEEPAKELHGEYRLFVKLLGGSQVLEVSK